MIVYCYKNCGTCKKALKFLDENKVEYEYKEIVEDIPTVEELLNYMSLFDGPAKKFFNTSGMKYRELGMKDKVKDMDENAMAEVLSTDGMLIKRPLLVVDGKVLLGFKIDDWKKII